MISAREMEQDVVAVHLEAVRSRLDAISARLAELNGTVARNDTRLSVLEPSVTTAHERLNELDAQCQSHAEWQARFDGKTGGMRELITLVAALAAAVASLIKLFH